MSRLRRVLWNPIVSKEYRARMRTWRSPLAMTLYILLLGGLGWAIFSSEANAAQNSYGATQAATYGHDLFIYLIIFQVLLLTFIVPALTAGAVSGERERQTIDLLFVTRIPPFSIIWGKLLASMSFVIVLLLLSVPIFSLVFLFGGIELDQVLTAFLITGVTALTLGILGIFFSTVTRRTLPATVGAYVAAFILVAGSLLYGQVFPTNVDPTSTKAPAPPALTYLSPIVPLVTIANNGPMGNYGLRYPNSGPGGISTLNGGGVQTICKGVSNGGSSCVTVQVAPAPGQARILPGVYQTPTTTGTIIPSGLFGGWQYWQATAFMQLVIALIALVISGLVLPPVRRLPWRRRAAVTAG